MNEIYLHQSHQHCIKQKYLGITALNRSVGTMMMMTINCCLCTLYTIRFKVVQFHVS